MSLYGTREATRREEWMFLDRRRCELVGQVRLIRDTAPQALAGIIDHDERARMYAKGVQDATDRVLRLLSEAGFHDGGYA